MAVQTYEGIVEGGRINIEGGIDLPDRTKVLIVVQNGENHKQQLRFRSPRLADSNDLSDFRFEIVEDRSDA